MSVIPEQEFDRRAAEIEWMLCDVDGVLTDGGLYYDRRGHGMLRFDVRDGLGLELAQRAGIGTGILSGRASAALDHRAQRARPRRRDERHRGQGAALEPFVEQRGIAARQVAFIGDDLPDLVALARCGLTFAPADAAPRFAPWSTGCSRRRRGRRRARDGRGDPARAGRLGRGLPSLHLRP